MADERRPRRRAKRSHENSRGLVIGLSLGGVGIVVLVGVLAVGSSRGWFRKSSTPVIAGPAEEKGIAPVVRPKPNGPDPEVNVIAPVVRPKPKGPNKELQRIYDRITLEQWSVETVEKMLGRGREAAPAEVDGLFEHVAFKKQIYEQFDKYRNDLKIQRWLIWEREGALLILGLSRFRSGKVGISMMGIWNETNRAFFNMSVRANAVDIE
jgi:hypothetical protein